MKNIELDNKYSGISYVFNYIEMRAIIVVYSMENQGVKVDYEYAEQLSLKYNKLLE